MIQSLVWCRDNKYNIHFGAKILFFKLKTMKKTTCVFLLLILGLILEVDSNNMTSINLDNIKNANAGAFDIRPAIVEPNSQGSCKSNEVLRRGKCRVLRTFNEMI